MSHSRDCRLGRFRLWLHLAKEKGLTILAEGLDDLPDIQADERRLFNAFYNLINNAIPEVPVPVEKLRFGAPSKRRPTQPFCP